MISLRSYIREILKEEGELQIRVLRQAKNIGKFSIKDVPGGETKFFTDTLQGMATLGAASRAFRSSKSGSGVKAAFDATRGSRKNVIAAVAGLGVIGYVVTQAVRDKHGGENPKEVLSDDKKKELTEAFAKYHNDLLEILNSRTDDNVNAMRTQDIVRNPTMTVEIATRTYAAYEINYKKYVESYVKQQELDGSFETMYTQNPTLVSTRGQISDLIRKTASEHPEFDPDGLKYYAACAMYVHLGELIAASLDADYGAVAEDIAANEPIVKKYDDYRKAKRAEMETPAPKARLEQALHALDSIL